MKNLVKTIVAILAALMTVVFGVINITENQLNIINIVSGLIILIEGLLYTKYAFRIEDYKYEPIKQVPVWQFAITIVAIITGVCGVLFNAYTFYMVYTHTAAEAIYVLPLIVAFAVNTLCVYLHTDDLNDYYYTNDTLLRKKE